eukprot:758444-Hanusia_phi.AAC.1
MPHLDIEITAECCAGENDLDQAFPCDPTSAQDFASKEILPFFDDNFSEDAFRYAQYGCPPRSKQLECLQRAIVLITNKTRLYGVSGKWVGSKSLFAPTSKSVMYHHSDSRAYIVKGEMDQKPGKSPSTFFVRKGGISNLTPSKTIQSRLDRVTVCT